MTTATTPMTITPTADRRPPRASERAVESAPDGRFDEVLRRHTDDREPTARPGDEPQGRADAAIERRPDRAERNTSHEDRADANAHASTKATASDRAERPEREGSADTDDATVESTQDDEAAATRRPNQEPVLDVVTAALQRAATHAAEVAETVTPATAAVAGGDAAATSALSQAPGLHAAGPGSAAAATGTPGATMAAADAPAPNDASALAGTDTTGVVSVSMSSVAPDVEAGPATPVVSMAASTLSEEATNAGAATAAESPDVAVAAQPAAPTATELDAATSAGAASTAAATAAEASDASGDADSAGELTTDPAAADAALTDAGDGPADAGTDSPTTRLDTTARPDGDQTVNRTSTSARGDITTRATDGTRAAAQPSMAANADDLLAQAELRRVTAGGRRLDIGIATQDLGTVRVEAIDRGAGLQLQLSSDQAGGRSQLNAHLAELRADLADRGVDVGSLDVGDAPSDHQRGREERDGRRSPISEQIDTPLVTGPRPARATAIDGLDLRL